MPADSLPEIYDFEDALAAAFKSYLADENISATPQIARDINAQSAPAVLLRIEHGGAIEGFENQAKLFTNDGNFSKDTFFEGRLITTIRTNRQADSADDDHKLLRRSTRAALYDCMKATAGIDDQLTYHSIRGIREASTDYAVEDEGELDDTEITWELVYCIKSDAWPV